MQAFLASQLFTLLILPLAVIGLTVFVRAVTRNDRYSDFSWQDIAVGLDLMVAGWFLILADTASSARSLSLMDPVASELEYTALSQHLEVAPWLIAIFAVLLWGVSTLVRKQGWRQKDELNVLGIWLPLALGLGVLIFTVKWIGG